MEFQLALKNSKLIPALGVILIMHTACEEEYVPKPSGEGPKYVVEGYIEAGQNPFPPHVILTRTFDFYGELGPEQFDASFVHDAEVIVSEGGQQVVLPEFCFSDLPPELRKEAAALFGFNADSLAINFCVYADILGLLQPEEGRTYDLVIRIGDDVMMATTHIPLHVPIDSMRFAPPPGTPNDTLAQLRCYVSDPPGVRNFYRYRVSVNGGAFLKSFTTVAEDLYFDGKSFGFQLLNPETMSDIDSPDDFGLYFAGDTVTVKWMSLDEAHFDFWNTLEFSSANQGPLASYTRLQSNINGGLGVWGGYSVTYYTQVVAY